MNQITTRCANCFYNLNDHCIYGNSCSGVTCVKPDANGHLVTLPVDAPVVSAIEPQLVTHCLICGNEVLIHKFEKGPKICNECKKAIDWAKGHVVTARKVEEYDLTRLKELMKEKMPISSAPIDMITEGKAEALELIKEKLSLDKITSFILSKDLMEGKLTLLNLVEFILAEIKREPESSGVKASIEAEKEDSLEYRQKKDPNGFRITVKEFVQRFVPHGSKVLLVESTIRSQGNNTNTFKIYHNALWEGQDYLITDPIENCPKDLVCNLRDWLVEGVVVNAEYLPLTGKVTLSILRDNEKTSEEKITEEVRRWLTQTNSEMNGTKDTIIATNSKEEAMESKPEIIKPNTAIATTEGKIENAC